MTEFSEVYLGKTRLPCFTPPLVLDQTKSSYSSHFRFCRFSSEDVQPGHRPGEAGGTGEAERHGEHRLHPGQGGLLPSRHRVRHCGLGPHH